MKQMKPLALPFIVVLSAIVCFSTSALAVEDGLGTNIVRNLRVVPNGTLSLGDMAVTNWTLLPVGTGAVSLVNFNNTTNALNTAATNVSFQVTNVLYGATNVLNTATNALNTAVTNLSFQVTNLLYGATNVLNTATNALNTNKLDRVRGVAGDLSVTGIFVQVVATSTQVISIADNVIEVDDTFIPIVGDAPGNVMATIADDGFVGQIIILQGQSDTAMVTLTNNPSKVELCNGVNFTFKENNTMQLIRNNGVWAELNRVAQ